MLSHLEIECAFTVLEIDFLKSDLRKLLRLTDSNKDGVISLDEFFNMVNKP